MCYDVVNHKLFCAFHQWSMAEYASLRTKERASSPLAEITGVNFWLKLFHDLITARRLLLAVDADCVMQMISKSFSDDPLLLHEIREFRMGIASEFCSLRVRTVLGWAFNRVADLFSHGLFQEAH